MSNVNDITQNFINAIYSEINNFNNALELLKTNNIDNWEEWKELYLADKKFTFPKGVKSVILYTKINNIKNELDKIQEIQNEIQSEEDDDLCCNYFRILLRQQNKIVKEDIRNLSNWINQYKKTG